MTVVYDDPPKRKCPYNMRSANGGTICFREFTPLLDSLRDSEAPQGSTDFPAPQIPIRKPREKSLTELMGGA